jgi:pimeloyl-ACP methyl ester carboxylesterase
MSLRDFHVAIAQSDLDDLQRRLQMARWDTPAPDLGWQVGMQDRFLRRLTDHWQHRFDWRAVERQINSHANILCDVAGTTLHALQQKSTDPGAIPLLLIHGWPGSFLEFLHLIEPLTSPAQGPAFHVVCPSIPGYGFSGAPRATGMNTRAIAPLFVQLMKRLGYDRFLVQGGDWGSLIGTQIARQFPENCLGLHLNLAFSRPPEDVADPMTLVEPHERRWVEELQQLYKDGMGYSGIHSTRPQTLAYGLNDSPLGLAAWIGEKYIAWSDPEVAADRRAAARAAPGNHGTGVAGDGPNDEDQDDDAPSIPMDRILANISLYWFTQTLGSSIRLYYEDFRDPGPATFVTVPTGMAIFPKELVKAPRRWNEKRYNLVHWTLQKRGGHFAAMEVPELFLADLRQFAAAI